MTQNTPSQGGDNTFAVTFNELLSAGTSYLQTAHEIRKSEERQILKDKETAEEGENADEILKSL